MICLRQLTEMPSVSEKVTMGLSDYIPTIISDRHVKGGPGSRSAEPDSVSGGLNQGRVSIMEWIHPRAMDGKAPWWKHEPAEDNAARARTYRKKVVQSPIIKHSQRKIFPPMIMKQN